MFSWTTHLAIFALGWTTVTATTGINLTALFGSSLSPEAKIYSPADANYTQDVTQRWTVHDAPTYFGAIKVATEADVQNTVKIAIKNKIPFLATGGGHGDSITLGNLKQGLEIDLSQLNSVTLDATNNLMTIGGGTRFQDVLEPLYSAGKEMPIGTAICVGIVGATLGAGVSSMQGHHGLLIDTLKSVRLVTASGDAINVSKDENADLFWGLRGAGASFGIITSATYEVFDFTNQGQVLVTDFEYYGYDNESVWKILETFDNTLPSLLALNIAVQYDPVGKQLGMIVNSNYFGPQADGLRYLQPLIDLGPVLTSIQMVPWTNVINSSYFGLDAGACADGQYVNAYTVAAKRTDPTTLKNFTNGLLEFANQNPDVHPSFVIHRFPTQAVLAVPDDETAYPHRQIKMHFQLETSYAPNNTVLENAVNTFSQAARTQLQKTSGFKNLVTYVNFAHGDEGPQSWYGERKLGRLMNLKNLWDPNQTFSYYNAIPLH